MIKNTITYKNNVILTIYHQHFPMEHLTPKKIRKEYIQKNIIQFSEEYVPDEEWTQLTGYAWEEHALVPPKEKYNPYHSQACANMTHRIVLSKPPVIYNKHGIPINGKILKAILSFIQTYTGMDLEECPVFLGDIFLFSPSELEHHCTPDNTIVLHQLSAGMRIILHLKCSSNILETKALDITADAETYEIPTQCDWNSYDIELYQNDRLIYINHDISYARTMYFTMSTPGPKKRVPLMALQDYYELETQSTFHKSVIGVPPEPAKEALAELNRTLVRGLHNQKTSDRFLFIKPGKLSIAMEKITDFIFHATDEIWLIDSYFTDQNHSSRQMLDWLRLIASSAAPQQHIVFYCGTASNALTAAQLKDQITHDSVIPNTLAQKHSTHMRLLQTKTAIHDRFLITRSGDTYSGLSIGTSFNSLNSNHYCIHTLKHQEAEEVLDSLCAWMDTNTAAQEEL